MGRRKRSLAERTWEKIDRRGPDECWPWQAARSNPGYGILKVDGAMRLAHRVVWELTYGGPPPGRCVLHRCDNPPCCNPAHLFIGTRADNAADRDAKGRGGGDRRRGERNGSAKLTADDVRAIRRDYEPGHRWRPNAINASRLADRHGISIQQVHSIIQGRTWSHITT